MSKLIFSILTLSFFFLISPSAYCQDETIMLSGKLLVDEPRFDANTFLPVKSFYNLGVYKSPLEKPKKDLFDTILDNLSESNEDIHYIDNYSSFISEKFFDDSDSSTNFKINALLKIERWNNGGFTLNVITPDNPGSIEEGTRSVWISPADITVDYTAVAFNITNIKGEGNWMMISCDWMVAYFPKFSMSLFMKFDTDSSEKTKDFIMALRHGKSEKITILKDASAGMSVSEFIAKGSGNNTPGTPKTAPKTESISPLRLTLPEILTTVAGFGKLGTKMPVIKDKVEAEGYKFSYEADKYVTVAFCSPECGMAPELMNDRILQIPGLPDKYTQAIATYYINNNGKLCLDYTFWFENLDTSAYDSMEFISSLMKSMNNLGYRFDYSVDKLEDVQTSGTTQYGSTIICRQNYTDKKGKVIFGASLYVIGG